MTFSNYVADAPDDEDYLLDIKDIIMGPLIGQGQFATVYMGKYFGDYVAVKKQVREAKLLETYLIREIALLQKAKHENLISFFGAHNEVNDDGCEHVLYIVTEFCPGGDLLELLVNNPQELGWKFRIKIALQAASAINYLHQNNFIHRDIKSSNLLIDQDWQCKVCDFGMAVEINPDVARTMTLCGTTEYMAPELMFDEQNYSFEVDIFSLGMVLLEVLKRGKVGHSGFAERNPRSMFRLDNDVIRSMLPEDSPDSLIALALQCVDDDALSRPASCDVVDWLQDLYDTSDEDEVGPPILNPLEWDSQGETSRSFGGEETIWTAPNTFKPPHSLPGVTLSSMVGNGMSPLKTNYDSNSSSSRNSPAYFIPFSSHPPLSPVPSGGQPEAPDTSFTLGQQDTWEESRDYRDEEEPLRPTLSNPNSPGNGKNNTFSPNGGDPKAAVKIPGESSMFGIGKGIFSNGTVGAPSPTRIPAAASAFASSPSSAGAALAEANSAARSPAPEVKKPAPSLFGMFSPRTPSLISHPASLNSLSTVTDAYVRTSSTQSALESAKMKALASDSYKRIDTSGILARDGLEIGDSGNKNKIVSADSLDDGVSDDVSSTGESELNMSRGGAHNYYGNTNAHTLKDPHTHAKNNNNSLVDVSALSLRPLDNTLNHIMNDTNNSTSELKTMNDSFGTNSEGNDVLTNMSNCSFSPCNAANDNTTLSQSSVSPSNSPSKGRVTSYKMPPLTEQNSFNQRKSDIEVYYLGILYKKNSTGFFRNWKKVCVTVSGYTLKWASTSETRSKWYAMKGATVAKTMQYRFQITNMTELRERESTGGSSYSGKEGLKRVVTREFAAESVGDMEEWVSRVQACIDRCDGTDKDKEGTQKKSLTFVNTPLRTEVIDRSKPDVHITSDSNTETQSISSQFESDEFEDSQRDKLSSTPLTAPSTTTVATPIPSPDTRVAVTKYKCFGSDVTLFTVVAVWNSQRSSLAMHYTDFREFDETMRHVMNVSPLVRDMPILIRPADFNSTLQLFKIWCVGKDEAAHSELKGLSDADSKAILQLSALNSYIVTVGALVDRTPYLEAFLELLDVLPDKAETAEGSHSNALNAAKPIPSKLPNTRASI